MMQHTTKSSERMGCTFECWMPRVDWMASNRGSPTATPMRRPASMQASEADVRLVGITL